MLRKKHENDNKFLDNGYLRRGGKGMKTGQYTGHFKYIRNVLFLGGFTSIITH